MAGSREWQSSLVCPTHRREEAARLDQARRDRQRVEIEAPIGLHDNQQRRENHVHEETDNDPNHTERVGDQARIAVSSSRWPSEHTSQ
eukprot:5932996-Prymnesium_polylepis.2